MKISGKMFQLNTESAFKVLAQAQALEARGVNVVHLEIGEPDFATPAHICEAAEEAIENGQTRYCNSQGLPALREEIAAELERTRGIAVDPDCVIVTPGAKPVMFYAMLALLDAGDEAIYPNPSFPIYESMIKFCGARPVPVRLHEEQDFRFDIDELKARVTPNTRLIILNSPQNPTGSVLEKEDLEAIAGIARENDIAVMSDEIYEHFIYEGEHSSIAALPGMMGRTVLISGFSKSHAMTGWRLGYGVLPKEMVEPVVRLIVNSVSCTAPFIQYAGIRALSGPKDDMVRMVEEFRQRRDLIVRGLNEIPGISCRLPRGAFYAFPNVTALGMKSQEFADYLLNEAGVATLAGTGFGEYGEGYIRLSYANSRDNIGTALERIKTAAARL
jgi:aspartate aminotransferase